MGWIRYPHGERNVQTSPGYVKLALRYRNTNSALEVEYESRCLRANKDGKWMEDEG